MESKTILLIDDDEDQLVVLGVFLETNGYLVSTTTRAEDAIALTRNNTFDAIVCDVMMPGTDGKELVRILRNDSSLDSTPIIMLSAARDDLAAELSILGADEFCLKNEVRRSLVPMLNQVIANNRTPEGESIRREVTEKDA